MIQFKTTLTITFLLISFYPSFAQMDGYVITAWNDTIHGKIDNPFNDLKSSRRVKIELENGKTRRFTPIEAKAYYDGIYHYVKHKGVFAKVLVSGQAQLFEFDRREITGGGFAVGGQGIQGATVSSTALKSIIMRLPNEDLVELNKYSTEMAGLTLFDKKTSKKHPIADQIIFSDHPELHKKIQQNYRMSYQQIVSNYNRFLKRRIEVPSEISAYQNEEEVNILLFRRNQQIDIAQGAYTISINGKKVGQMNNGEYLYLTLSEAEFYTLKIRSRKGKFKYQFYGRRDHVMPLEIASGDITVVYPIEAERALPYLRSDKKIEAKDIN